MKPAKGSLTRLSDYLALGPTWMEWAGLRSEAMAWEDHLSLGVPFVDGETKTKANCRGAKRMSECIVESME